MCDAGDGARFRRGCCVPVDWSTLVEDKDAQPPNGDLSTSQQTDVSHPSRCARISGWAFRAADVPVRGSGGYRASAASAACDRRRGTSPEARHLRGLTVDDRPWGRPPYDAAYFFSHKRKIPTC